MHALKLQMVGRSLVDLQAISGDRKLPWQRPWHLFTLWISPWLQWVWNWQGMQDSGGPSLKHVISSHCCFENRGCIHSISQQHFKNKTYCAGNPSTWCLVQTFKTFLIKVNGSGSSLSNFIFWIFHLLPFKKVFVLLILMSR